MRIRRREAGGRRGVVAAEAAVAYSLTMLLILGTIILGLGVFRYQQVAELAREGSRWASVKGPTYQQTNSAPTSASLQAYIASRAVGLDTTKLTCTLTTTSTSTQNGVVTVVVNYQWVPEAYWGSVTLSSTSAVPVTY